MRRENHDPGDEDPDCWIARVIERIRDLHSVEPPEGWRERLHARRLAERSAEEK